MKHNFKKMSDEELVALQETADEQTIAAINAELEARLQFDPISVGLYAGYRVVRYNEIEGEGSIIKIDANGTDNDGDTWFVGLRVTWTFLSPWEKRQQNKI